MNETVRRPMPTAVALAEADMGARETGVSPIIPRTAAEVGDYCRAMIAFEAIPAAYEKLPENKRLGQMVVAVMKGLELGMTPLRALQFIYVVNGIPTLYGDAIPAFVMGSGLVEDWQESFEGTGDDRVAIVRAKRRGVASYMERRFSVKDAAGQKLLGKTGPWQHSRDRMKMIRARTYLARDLFADALHGLGVKEEQEDILRSQGINPEAITIAHTTTAIDPLADDTGDGAEDAEFTETPPSAPDADRDAEGNDADGPASPFAPDVTEDSAPGFAPGQPGDAGGARTTSPAVFPPIEWNGFAWDASAPETIEIPFTATGATGPQLQLFGKMFRALLEQSPDEATARAWVDLNPEPLLIIASKSKQLNAYVREPLQKYEIAADSIPAATGDASDPGGSQSDASPASSTGGAA